MLHDLGRSDFEKKAADIIALYLHPPQHAAVFCVDEKTAIQALDRLDPCCRFPRDAQNDMALSIPAWNALALRSFQYQDRRVLGKTAARHTSAEFVAFLTDIVVNQPRGKEIHVIADNLSATRPAGERVPRGASEGSSALHSDLFILAQPVELWFSKIERDVIARGVFTSVPDLKRKLMRYIREYNKEPRTVK